MTKTKRLREKHLSKSQEFRRLHWPTLPEADPPFDAAQTSANAHAQFVYPSFEDDTSPIFFCFFLKKKEIVFVFKKPAPEAQLQQREWKLAQ
jgi:hypothetical protein